MNDVEAQLHDLLGRRVLGTAVSPVALLDAVHLRRGEIDARRRRRTAAASAVVVAAAFAVTTASLHAQAPRPRHEPPGSAVMTSVPVPSPASSPCVPDEPRTPSRRAAELPCVAPTAQASTTRPQPARLSPR